MFIAIHIEPTTANKTAMYMNNVFAALPKTFGKFNASILNSNRMFVILLK